MSITLYDPSGRPLRRTMGFAGGISHHGSEPATIDLVSSLRIDVGESESAEEREFRKICSK